MDSHPSNQRKHPSVDVSVPRYLDFGKLRLQPSPRKVQGTVAQRDETKTLRGERGHTRSAGRSVPWLIEILDVELFFVVVLPKIKKKLAEVESVWGDSSTFVFSWLRLGSIGGLQVEDLITTEWIGISSQGHLRLRVSLRATSVTRDWGVMPKINQTKILEFTTETTNPLVNHKRSSLTLFYFFSGGRV